MNIVNMVLAILGIVFEKVGLINSKKIKPEVLRKMIRDHQLWLEKGKGWSDSLRAEIPGANLRKVNLRGVNLRSADLTRVDLRGADLRGADLSDACLYKADLRGADLTGADLRAADLYLADLRGANLWRALVKGANMGETKLDIGILDAQDFRSW